MYVYVCVACGVWRVVCGVWCVMCGVCVVGVYIVYSFIYARV
jgi:hypothetical protein